MHSVFEASINTQPIVKHIAAGSLSYTGNGFRNLKDSQHWERDPIPVAGARLGTTPPIPHCRVQSHWPDVPFFFVFKVNEAHNQVVKRIAEDPLVQRITGLLV